MNKKVIRVATGNAKKFEEIRSILEGYGLKAEMVEGKTLEIQHDDIKAIAETALRQALSNKKGPLLLEDAGLFIDALKGFPGPYSSYVFRTVGVEGIIQLMKGVKSRDAEFKSIVAYGGTVRRIWLFEGNVKGCITETPRGSKGFGFDPIFTPLDHSKTFAEVTMTEKNQVSHRGQALMKFTDWYNANVVKD
ncbi:MAG: XTP/dITP diphosphatase [Thaumarchaeota archaeon]|nr:XTP/dITP diphosphatase [Nitrososphaerota archaeon]